MTAIVLSPSIVILDAGLDETCNALGCKDKDLKKIRGTCHVASASFGLG
jgi:hypothetical protein